MKEPERLLLSIAAQILRRLIDSEIGGNDPIRLRYEALILAKADALAEGKEE